MFAPESPPGSTRQQWPVTSTGNWPGGGAEVTSQVRLPSEQAVGGQQDQPITGGYGRPDGRPGPAGSAPDLAGTGCTSRGTGEYSG